MSFTPSGYEPPKTGNSNYMKFQDGDNVIRILGKPILGWLDWQEIDGKPSPVRTPYRQEKPAPLNPKRPVRHFWAMPIWDYKEECIKILEITQSTIQEALFNLDCDEAWGSPTQYDLNIKKTGKDLDTKYNVIARPPKELAGEIGVAYRETKINLDELFRNGDPFNSDGYSVSPQAGTVKPDLSKEIYPDETPFPEEDPIDVKDIRF